MKKTILTSICAFGLAGGAFAQATLNWGAISATYFTAQTNTAISSYTGGTETGGTSGSAIGAGNFYYELLYSSGTDVSSLSAIADWTDTGLEGTSTAAPGRATPMTSNTGAAVSGWAVNATYNVVLVGWSANLGTTWSAALATLESSSQLAALASAAYFGVSSIASITPTSNGAPGATVFGPSAIDSPNTQLYLVQVPEPTTIALAGLGAISLLALRRKK